MAGGTRFFTYGNPDTRSMVLVDVGGPGVNVGDTPGLDGVISQIPKRLRRAHQIVVIEEPWVVDHTTQRSRCRLAASSWLASARNALARNSDQTALSSTASALWQHCREELDRSGWTPTTYNRAIRSVTRALGAHLDGFVGISYGAVRRLYIDADHQPTWTVIVDPAPLPDSDESLAAMIKVRADAVDSSVAATCPLCAPGWERRLDSTARALDLSPVKVPGRSLPVDGADVRAAAILIGRQQASTAQELLTAITGGGGLTNQQAALVASVSDGAFSRYGKLDLAPQAFAYIDEICRAYRGRATQSDASPKARTLAVMHSACDQRTLDPFTLSPPADVAISCIATHAEDFIASASIQGWRARHPEALLDLLGRATHGSLADLACWKALTP